MNYRKVLKDFSIAIVSQGISVLVSVLMTLLLPKVLGVTEFGYWQLFIFYIGYISFFNLGLNDGMYLLNGGKTWNSINAKSINSQFWFSVAFQLPMALVVACIAWFGGFEGPRAFVILMIAAILIVNNAALYLGYLFQAVNETKLFSISVALESAVFAVPLLLLLGAGIASFEPYVIFYIFAKVVRLAYCLAHARNVLSSGLIPLVDVAHLAAGSIRVGVKLLVANSAASLIIGIVRFVIDLEWGIDVFSAVSFALSMVSFFMLFIGQVSLVLFPNLRRVENDELVSFYVTARDSLGLLLPAIYILYVPAVFLLNLWLPAYADSFRLFAILLPLCVFNGKTDIIGTTYLKVLRRENHLLTINVATMVVSSLFAFIGVYALHSIEVTLLFTVAVVAGRCMYMEHHLNAAFACPANGIGVASAIVSFASIAINYCLEGLLAMGLLVALYVLYLIVFRSELRILRLKLTGALSYRRRKTNS